MAKKETEENNGKATNTPPEIAILLKEKGFDWHTCNYREFLAFLKRNNECFTPLNQAARDVVAELSENPE